MPPDQSSKARNSRGPRYTIITSGVEIEAGATLQPRFWRGALARTCSLDCHDNIFLLLMTLGMLIVRTSRGFAHSEQLYQERDRRKRMVVYYDIIKPKTLHEIVKPRHS